jgi:hypothetical protein
MQFLPVTLIPCRELVTSTIILYSYIVHSENQNHSSCLIVLGRLTLLKRTHLFFTSWPTYVLSLEVCHKLGTICWCFPECVGKLTWTNQLFIFTPAGIFTVAGIIDSFVYHGHRAIKKKMEIGKLGWFQFSAHSQPSRSIVTNWV